MGTGLSDLDETGTDEGSPESIGPDPR